MFILKWVRIAWQWLQKQFSFASFLSTAGIIVIILQLSQSQIYKKYDNFLHFNQVYDQWYDEMPKRISDDEQASFTDLDGAGRAWVRRYFNLYSQEFYFYQAGMIPKEMWWGLIHGCKDGKTKAAFSNLKKYPALLQGYVCWKKEGGAFEFPHGFIDMLDKELKQCKISMPAISCSY